MTGASSPLYLAAGTILDAEPLLQIEAAARAGFDGLGLRLDPTAVSSAELRAIRAAIDRHRLTVFDVEVIRLASADPYAGALRLIEIAGELGARWVLTVVMTEDGPQRRLGLGRLSAAAAVAGVGIALEFMRFTAIPTLAVAAELVGQLHDDGHANAGVLVDALHLLRGGNSPDDVRRLPPGHVAYAQLCDAPNRSPGDLDALAFEARHDRLMPGAGAIDLPALIAALPAGIPMTVEVQSDSLAARLDPVERARLAYSAAAPLLGRTVPAAGE